MTKKQNQALSEGAASPKIRPGDIWKDSFGAQVMITDITPNRVSFVRDGYAHPCTCPLGRLEREFTFVSAGGLTAADIEQADSTTTTSAERIAVIRDMLDSKAGGLPDSVGH
jgi:hypothetical protein